MGKALKSTERRMKLLLLLQSNQHLTVNEIAERFDISRRTVFRDLNFLQDLNVPVTWDKDQGYGIMRGYTIPPLMFTARELATIMMGLSFVKSQVDATLANDAKDVELKIYNVLPGNLKEWMSALEKQTIVDPFLHFGLEKKEGGNWFAVSNAIAERKRMEFDYSPKSGGESEQRIVEPYLLVFYRDHWNVIGFSHKRKSMRNFLLDRMENVKIRDDSFRLPDDIDIEGLIFHSDEPEHRIALEVSENELTRLKANLPTKFLKLEEKKPKLFRIEFSFDNLDYINQWLLQFADQVKIIKPKKLRDKRRDLLQRMIDRQD